MLPLLFQLYQGCIDHLAPHATTTVPGVGWSDHVGTSMVSLGEMCQSNLHQPEEQVQNLDLVITDM